jgi:hypothetical protein
MDADAIWHGMSGVKPTAGPMFLPTDSPPQRSVPPQHASFGWGNNNPDDDDDNNAPPPPQVFQALLKKQPPPQAHPVRYQHQQQSILPTLAPHATTAPPLPPPQGNSTATVEDVLAHVGHKASMVPRLIKTLLLVGFLILAGVAVSLYVLHQSHGVTIRRVDHHESLIQGLINTPTTTTSSSPPSKKHAPSSPPTPTKGRYPQDESFAGRGVNTILKTFDVATPGAVSYEWPDVPFARLDHYDLCCHINSSTFVCGDLFATTLFASTTAVTDDEEGVGIRLHVPHGTVASCRMRLFLQPEE